MKKLALNKTTIANLDSPEKIVGGVTHSYAANTIRITCLDDTCLEYQTCDGHGAKCLLTEGCKTFIQF